MVRARKRVRQSLVSSNHAGAKPLGQRDVHEVVNRPVVGDGQSDGVSTDGLVGVPSNRHVRHGGDELACGATVNFA